MHAGHGGQLHVSVKVDGRNSNPPAETGPELEVQTSSLNCCFLLDRLVASSDSPPCVLVLVLTL